MKNLLFAYGLLFVAACNGDESVAKYGAAGKVWVLTEMGGTAFTARATMEFGEDGRVSGKAPCNSYSAQQSVPYPWFKLGPVMSTKMACPDLARETAFFAMLEKMTLSEVSNETLILSNDADETMVFKAE